MSKQVARLSRVLQMTALLAFAFGFWRLWTYFTRPLDYPHYMLYGVAAACLVGVGILCFDEVAKIENTYVGWAFLFSIGVFALHAGFLFTIFPEMDLTHPIYLMPTRALGLFLLGGIILIESVLVWRIAIPNSYRLGSKTIMPIVLKTTAIMTIPWGTYLVIWELFNLAVYPPIPTIAPLILGITSIVVGCILLAWVETQKRKISFRRRKLPIIFSFIFVFVTPVIGGYYFHYGLETFILPIHVALGIALIIESGYIFYNPTKTRQQESSTIKT